MLTTAPKDEVTLLIDGTELRLWSSVSLTFSLDAFTTFTFTAPFDPETAIHRDMFRPLQYQTVEVRIDGDTVLTGTVVTIEPKGTANESQVTVSGYSKAGVTLDCHMPEGYALEFRDAPLQLIIQHIASSFGIPYQTLLDNAWPFEKELLDVDARPLEFLANLAKQRGAVISDTADGGILCWQSYAGGSPVAVLDGAATTALEQQTNSQEYFSEVTGYAETKRGSLGQRYTYNNPLLKTVRRPHTFRISDSDKADSPYVVAAKIGRMFGNVASWSLPQVASWRDPNGNLWRPNTTVLMKAPNLMVYRETEFLVRTVTLEATHEVRRAALGFVLPGAFAGIPPERWPWDE